MRSNIGINVRGGQVRTEEVIAAIDALNTGVVLVGRDARQARDIHEARPEVLTIFRDWWPAECRR